MDLQLNVVEIDKEVDNAKFTTLFTFLTAVFHGNFNTQSISSLLNHWLVIGQDLKLYVYLIYSATTPASIYLQTKTINYLQAWNMIATLKKEMMSMY